MAYFAGSYDRLRIFNEGKKGRKEYALTVTTRKQFKLLEDFRTEFYIFLKTINYDFQVDLLMEYHEKKNCIHAHGIAFGNPAIKNNKYNDFTLHIVPIKDIKGWITYCMKEELHTLERDNDNKTGGPLRRPLPYCFSDDEVMHITKEPSRLWDDDD